MKVNWCKSLSLLTALIAFVSEAEALRLEYPIPGAPQRGQAIFDRKFELNQTKAEPFVYGVFAKCRGLDEALKPSHRKFGIELHVVYQDGREDWYSPHEKLSPANEDWQTILGVYDPKGPVSRVTLFCRLATKGEAWFDAPTVLTRSSASFAPCALKEGKDGEYLMSNGFLSLSVNPSQGAVVTSLKDLKTGVDYTSARDEQSLLLDGFRGSSVKTWKRTWLSQVLVSTPEELAVEMKLPGADGSSPYLELRRTLRLNRNSRALTVDYQWLNGAAAMGEIVIEPWIVNGWQAIGRKDRAYLLPTGGGIRELRVTGGDVRLSDLIGGWYATTGAGSATMALTFDYARYAESGFWLGEGAERTAEWTYQPVKVEAGDEFSTGVEFFTLGSVKRPDWVENGIAAEFVAAEDGRLQVRLTAARRTPLACALAVELKDGGKRTARGIVELEPDRDATLAVEAPAGEVRRAGLRAFNDGRTVFEADRSWEKGYVYRAKRPKAKPAEVKPFKLTLSRELETPHVRWARPYAGGRPKVLFLTDVHQQRENVELMQRLDLDVRTVRIASMENLTRWAMLDRYNTYTYKDANLSLKRELSAPFDVLVVGARLMDAVDGENRETIAKKLAAGAGLVSIGDNFAALRGDCAAEKWIAGNVSPDLLVHGSGRVSCETRGGHREVVLGYDSRGGLTPYIACKEPEIPFAYQEYSLSVVARAILWAAKMDVAVPEGLKAEESWVDVEPGFRIRHRVFKDGKGTYDWSAESVRTPKAADFTAFELLTKRTKAGGEIRGRLAAERGAARVELRDGHGRLLSFAEGVTGEFVLQVPEALTGLLFVKATLTSDGKTADVRTGEVFADLPRVRKDFPFAVGERAQAMDEKRYLTPCRMAVYRSLGVNQLRFWDAGNTPFYRQMHRYGFDENFSVYDARIGTKRFTDEFLNPYAKTKDRRYLRRSPCLHDAEYRRGLDAKIRRKLDLVAPFCPITCDCGDENTLTRWDTAFDFCFGPDTLRAMRTWLRETYGTLEALNAAWGTSFADWDAVTPDTTEEARARRQKTGRRSYAAWADHRRFMELTFCDSIAHLKAIMNGKMPGLPLDMSGTQPPNGWTGMDMWLVSKSVDEPAAYDSSLLGEMVRSFGRPFVKPWCGYGGGPVDMKRRLWTGAFNYLDYGISFWENFNFLMPDYTLPSTVKLLKRELVDLQSGGARLLRSLEGTPDVLLHYSQASVHLAQIEERYGELMAEQERWIKRFALTGKTFRYVAYAELEDGELDRSAAKILVLPHSAAMSEKEVAAVLRFRARGGEVFGDAESGLFDEHCVIRSASPLAGKVRTDNDLGPTFKDGYRPFYLRPREKGVEGRYWGYVRATDVPEGLASRTVALEKPAYVYDLRKKRSLGKVASFDVKLAAAEAAFFAALPYEIGPVSVQAAETVCVGDVVRIAVRVGLPSGAKACHPVRVDVIDPKGNRSFLYSGVADAAGGKGEWSFRTALDDAAGKWRIVVTDFITGRTASAGFGLVFRD